jgi:hypothetical protein
MAMDQSVITQEVLHRWLNFKKKLEKELMYWTLQEIQLRLLEKDLQLDLPLLSASLYMELSFILLTILVL